MSAGMSRKLLMLDAAATADEELERPLLIFSVIFSVLLL